MMGYMNSPEEPAKVLHPMFDIKSEVFKYKQQEPVQVHIIDGKQGMIVKPK